MAGRDDHGKAPMIGGGPDDINLDDFEMDISNDAPMNMTGDVDTRGGPNTYVGTSSQYPRDEQEERGSQSSGGGSEHGQQEHGLARRRHRGRQPPGCDAVLIDMDDDVLLNKIRQVEMGGPETYVGTTSHSGSQQEREDNPSLGRGSEHDQQEGGGSQVKGRGPENGQIMDPKKARNLRSNAMRGKWSDILKMYKQDRTLRTANEITGTKDTLLHMALSNGEEKVVADMVNLILEDDQNVKTILGRENNRKNTPLHLAATMGNVEMCKKIGIVDPSLIVRPNDSGETPLFLAALCGRKEAFLWLYYLYMKSPKYSSTRLAHYKRENGDTILHCAIAEGHIDVAIEIVHLYKGHMKDMMKRNKEGLSPLHLLAAQRSAFKSTAILERSFEFLIYYLYEGILKDKEKNRATTFEELQKRSPLSSNDILVKFIYWSLQFLLLFLPSKFLAPVKFGNISYRYFIVYLLASVLLSVLLFISVFALRGWFHHVRKMKDDNTWSLQILNELLLQASDEDMTQIISRPASGQRSISQPTEEDNGRTESESSTHRKNESESSEITIETPLMIAAKNGVVEMVEKILESFPSTIENVNTEKKNILLLAVECRQTKVYRFLCKQKWLSESLFRQVDKDGNNALHLAATLGVDPDWLNPGEKLAMSREIKWFEFVKKSMPYGSLEIYNGKMETPEDIFRESHKQLMKSDGEWVAKTSQACSVVSTLVVSVAFTTRTSVPGGYDPKKGYAILKNKQAFKIFTYTSIVALLFSLMSTICFLSVVASPSQSVLSWRYVPLKLYAGMVFMFYSIVLLWISFCAGNFFMLDDKSRKLHTALPLYILLSLFIIVLVVILLPTFIGPALSSFRRIPSPRRKTTHPIEYRRTKNKENGTDLKHQN